MRKLVSPLLVLSLFWGSVLAQPPEELGLAIAQEADRRDSGFKDFVAKLQMILTNQQGEVSHRRLRSRTLEVERDGEKRIMIFDTPADIKGTALLTYTHNKSSDDQWLYLPALKRVKRIASSNKSGPFVGSEFAYEDLGSQEVEKYRYKYLRDEPCDGGECFVIERYPVDRQSGYTRQVLWLDKAEYRAWKLEYYDRKNELLKVLKFSDYRQYLGKYWRAGKMMMVNVQTNKRTLLKWSDYRFRTGLTDRDFNRVSLKRAR